MRSVIRLLRRVGAASHSSDMAPMPIGVLAVPCCGLGRIAPRSSAARSAIPRGRYGPSCCAGYNAALVPQMLYRMERSGMSNGDNGLRRWSVARPFRHGACCLSCGVTWRDDPRQCDVPRQRSASSPYGLPCCAHDATLMQHLMQCCRSPRCSPMAVP